MVSYTETVSTLNSNINTGRVGCRFYFSLACHTFLPNEKHLLFLTGQFSGLISLWTETNGPRPQPGQWCHPRDAPDPPSCWDATAQGKHCAGPCSPEQPTQASPWLIKCSPTRNRVSRQFFILTKFKEFNSIVCACPSSPPPSSHRTHSSILPTSQDTALYKYISFNISSWEELTLSFKRIKCSYLFHFFSPERNKP